MAWKAELLGVKKDGGNVVASVRFSNDTGDTLDQDIPGNDLTPDSLAIFCQKRCEVLEIRDASYEIFLASDKVKGPIVLPRDKK